MTIEHGQILSHYRLLEKIGEGGMGVVWKAQDTVLGRSVAIKFLPADFAGDEARRQMFLMEARSASAINDAHIAQVYELGREGHLDFIVMEYVEGKPLNRIMHGRPLPPDKVADLGHQVAQALSRAHRKRLLHRDLRPSNILVTTEGEAKVVDFGLATLFDRHETGLAAIASTLDTTITEGDAIYAEEERSRTARLVGTLPYMSPEQVRAEKLDARSDIFSLGVILYEMATGQRPFSGATNLMLLEEIVRARPKPPHEISTRVPLDLERIIGKAMAPAQADRYQTMDDLAVDLKRLRKDLESGSSPSLHELRTAKGNRRPLVWPLTGGLVLVAISAGVWSLSARWQHKLDSRTIQILPLEVRGQGEGAEFAGRAFAEALAVNLAQWKSLTVLPVPEAADLAVTGGSHKLDAAMKLGAGRLLTGSLTREGRLVHASLSLIDTERNRILWGAQRDDDAGTLPGLAASFSRTIAAELGTTAVKRYDFVLNLTGSSPAMTNAPETAEAVGALKRFEIQHALDATQRLVTAFPKEPDALALRLCAVFYAHIRALPGYSRHVLEEAMADLTRVDPDNPMPDNVRCELFTGVDNQAAKAIEYASRQLLREDLTPAARAWFLRDRAGARNVGGDTSGGLDDISEAYRLDPTNHYNASVLGGIRVQMGDLGGAEVAFSQCAALAPEFEGCHWLLSRVLQKQGKWNESVEPARVLSTLQPQRAAYAMYAYVLFKSGKVDKARTAAEKAHSLPGNAADGAEDLARFWALSGNRAEALHLLRALVAAGALPSNFLADQDLVSLRDDPEFKALFVAAHVGK